MLTDCAFKSYFVFQLGLLLLSATLLLIVDSACCEIEEAPSHHANTKVIIIELDSLTKDCLYEALDSLPNISKILRGPDALSPYIYLPSVKTIIPSASSPANTSIYTGLYPSEHGVFATIWFDRGQAKIYKLISFSQDRINSILSERGISTIFDYVKTAGKTSLVSMLFISKGVEPTNWIRSSVFLWANSFWINLLKNFIPIPDPIHMDRSGTRGFLNGHIYSLSDGIEGFYRKNGSLPDLMVMHYFGFDIFSHYPHRYQVRQKWEMQKIQTYYLKHVIDPEVGRIVQWLKKSNLLGDCIFFFISDHGMTRIKQHLDDDTVKGLLAKKFKIRRLESDQKRAEAICIPGAGTKAIYIKNRIANDWKAPPSLKRDIKTAVDLLLQDKDIQNSMEFILVRQFPCERHEGVSEKDTFWHFDIKGYTDTYQTESDFLNALKPLSFLDSVYPEMHLPHYFRMQYSRDSAPDILLITKKGLIFAPDKAKYGHHGSIYDSDCLVSLMLGGPGLARIIDRNYIIKEMASVLDIVPTVGGLLNIDLPCTLSGKDIISEYCHGSHECLTQ